MYDKTNWYWIVGGDESRVFSSARLEYVPLDDTAYIAWQACGDVFVPTCIASEDELFDVIAPRTVSRAKGNQVLLKRGLMNQVTAIMTDPATPPEYRQAWLDVTEYDRNSPMMRAIAGLLGLSARDVCLLFIDADAEVI